MKYVYNAEANNKSAHQLSVENFKFNINKLIKYLEEENIKVILIPDVLDARKFNHLAKTYENFSERNQAIPNTLNQIDLVNKENDVHIDVAHLTNEGYENLAKGIFHHLVDNKLIE